MSETAERALLSGIIDYAGLFPPAALDLGPAFDNFLRYRPGPCSWMLARFVCPDHRLDELSDLVVRAPRSNLAVEATVVLPPTESITDLLEKTAASMARIRAAGARTEGRLRAGGLEARLPASLIGERDSAPCDDLLSRLSLTIEQGGQNVPVFIEQPLSLPALPLGLALRRFNEIGQPRSRSKWGLKLRCGGTAASAFPASGELAAAVIACRDAVVPFKATAGLHHPLPRSDKQLGARMHGFLNLFGGAILAGAHGLDGAALVEVLDDDDPASFRFTADRMHWRDLMVSADEIALFRQVLATSFGSCNFEEPVSDLIELGLCPSGEESRC